jgi:hypothetical protein
LLGEGWHPSCKNKVEDLGKTKPAPEILSEIATATKEIDDERNASDPKQRTARVGDPNCPVVRASDHQVV